MRKAIAAAMLGTALVGVPAVQTVSATSPPNTIPATATDDVDDDDDGDNTGLWGLLGLVGLVGLAGLARRRSAYVASTPITPAPPTAYGATSDPDRLP